MNDSPSVPPDSQPGGVTVLLVEDQDAVALAARRILTRQGYTVLAARNGSEALELLETDGTRVDIVVTDLSMPTMGGAELIRRLARSAPSLPIVYMSGFAGGDDLPPEMARHTFLQKPFTIEALTSAVRTALASRA